MDTRDNAMKKAYYAIIPANVRYDKDLKPNAKLLYGEITALCNEKGYCWASNSYFSKLYGVAKETVSRWINNLENKGYIYTQLIYKEGSKEIKERRIYITPIDKKVNTYCQNNQDPIDKKVNTPIDKNVKDNNTVLNNTVNITEEEEGATALYDKDFKLIVKTYNENIRPIAPIEAERLSKWLDEGMESEVIISAIEEAVIYNARSMGYIETILKSWYASNIKTKADLDAYKRDISDKRHKGGRNNGTSAKVSPGRSGTDDQYDEIGITL